VSAGGVEAERVKCEVAGVLLKTLEEGLSRSLPASGWAHIEPFDLAGSRADATEAAAADWRLA
jgi:hypothetical protein